MSKAAITTEQANDWFAAMLRNQPAAIGAETRAHVVAGLAATPTAEGMILRVKTDAGTSVDLYFNAVLAKAVFESVRQCGTTGHWLDGAGEIIVSAPAGAPRWRPQA